MKSSTRPWSAEKRPHIHLRNNAKLPAEYSGHALRSIGNGQSCRHPLSRINTLGLGQLTSDFECIRKEDVKTMEAPRASTRDIGSVAVTYDLSPNDERIITKFREELDCYYPTTIATQYADEVGEAKMRGEDPPPLKKPTWRKRFFGR